MRLGSLASRMLVSKTVEGDQSYVWAEANCDLHVGLSVSDFEDLASRTAPPSHDFII
jgi:hypothetical protein